MTKKHGHDEVQVLRTENEKLKGFARTVIAALWEGAGGDIDGGEVQEAAVKSGLIVETVATAEDLAGSDYLGEAGDPWFKYAGWMQEAGVGAVTPSHQGPNRE